MSNVLITGGSRGIGAACVRRFAQAGHRVWFLYEKEHAAAPVPPPAPKTKDQQFEDMMKAFMSESDSKLSGMRADHRTKSRRR